MITVLAFLVLIAILLTIVLTVRSVWPSRETPCLRCAERTAYTLGHEASYDEYLRVDPEPTKLGRREDDPSFPGGYEGGSIWRTAEEARAWLSRDGGGGTPNGPFAVYELDLPAPWSLCAGDPQPEGWYRLLRDARIVRKVP